MRPKIEARRGLLNQAAIESHGLLSVRLRTAFGGRNPFPTPHPPCLSCLTTSYHLYHLYHRPSTSTLPHLTPTSQPATTPHPHTKPRTPIDREQYVHARTVVHSPGTHGGDGGGARPRLSH